jgi:cellulose synthase/poly-beta-1,6-N-acetylglucosamine synthase-like glycosyltransferase
LLLKTVEILFWAAGVALLFCIAYLYFLAALSLIPEKKRGSSKKPETKFAIVIPANNEAKVIGKTLESIRNVNYPGRLYETVVIADNCSDETAKIVKEHGISCFERYDNKKKGKGFALQWAFERLKEGNNFDTHDAFVIVDADTIMDPDFLRAMDSRLSRGQMAIQGYYDVINPEASPMASLSYLGFVLSRNLRYKGRTRMGWSSNLLGNGMCFSKEVMGRFGWNATSIVEDVEYAVTLRLNGTKVSFAPEAKIFAEIPRTFKESRIQRSRWDIGKFQIRNKYLCQLMKEAIRTKDVSYLDTAMELLIPPFSLFLGLSFALFGLFMAIAFEGFTALSTVWFTIVSALIAYVLVGLVFARASWRIYKNLIYAPLFLLWRVETVIWGYFWKIGKKWLKTERREVR